MRVTPQTHAAHGEALLDTAARLFRSRGLDAVRIADVSAGAGLTHGAFYGHFPSKAALAGQACASAMDQAVQRWRQRADTARAEGRDPLHAIIARYLTQQHRDDPGGGCWLGAIGAETARAEPDLRSALADGATRLQAVLADELARRHPEWPEPARTRAAAAILAVLTGGLLLARALAATPDASRAALDAAAALARSACDTLP